MDDTESDAAPVDRIRNQELYERQPRYPRIVDEEPVGPHDLIHFVFVYAKEDYDTFEKFLGWFEEVTVENDLAVKYETHDSELFPSIYDEKVLDISEKAIFIMPFLSAFFCSDKLLRFFTSEVIGKTRLDQTFPKGALESTLKQQKKYAVRPIHTADPKTGIYEIPVGLTMINGIDFYIKDRNVKYVKNQVVNIVKKAITLYEDRKKVMVNVPTTSENQMANMLSAMKNVDLKPVTTQDDTSLEVDSGPNRQHNNTTCRMAIGQKPEHLGDELKGDTLLTGRLQQGEQLRKTVNNSFSCQEGVLIYNQEKLIERIGCIKVTCIKDNYGTGFRVGSMYFMTAFHVMEDVLFPFWKEVYERLTEEEREEMKWTRDKVPVDGAWKLSKFWPVVGSVKMEKLIKIGTESITNLVQIKFRLVSDYENSYLAQCSYDVAFASPSHDVVILELIGDRNLPNPLHLKTLNAAATQFHLIGHPGGKEQEHDPVCKIIKKQEELDDLKKEGILFFSKLGYPQEQVEKDYKPCVLSPDRLFFHCSESITHGASGSPLIVINNEKKAQVIGMLLRGHPKLCYNNDKDNGDRPDLLVESGISMEKVFDLLSCPSLHELAQNLFPEEF